MKGQVRKVWKPYVLCWQHYRTIPWHINCRSNWCIPFEEWVNWFALSALSSFRWHSIQNRSMWIVDEISHGLKTLAVKLLPLRTGTAFFGYSLIRFFCSKSMVFEPFWSQSVVLQLSERGQGVRPWMAMVFTSGLNMTRLFLKGNRESRPLGRTE